MAVINTNAKALFSQAALQKTDRSMTVAMQQLSTGKRINSSRDDAAGLSIATRMTHQIRSLNQAVRNAGDAINLIQTAEGATNEITDMMQRMRELAVQAVNDTNTNADRSYLDLEFQQLKQQIVQIADNTEWNGFSVLNGTAGQRVGEMPVYKVTSENKFGGVFIQPTTTRSIVGTGSGEVQTFALSGTPAVGTVNVAGVDVAITATENSLAKVADKIQTTLNNSTVFTSRGLTMQHSVPTVVTTDGTGASNETAAVTFKDMFAGQAVTVAGLKFTANQNVTGAQVADLYKNLAVGATTSAAATTLGSFSGALALFNSTGNSPTGATLSFTSATANTNVTDIVTTGEYALQYSGVEGDVPLASVAVGSTNLTVSTAVSTTRKASSNSVENFSDNGKFLQSGSLQFSVAAGATASSAVTATFINSDNQRITLTGTLSTTNPAVVKFAKADGLNSAVISADLTYTLQDADGGDLNLTTTPRALSVSVGVEGSIPSLRDGDLMINGMNVGPSLAADDLMSPRNNAAGSAIAKAAAINRIAVDQGETQGQIQAITFSGTPMPGTITVGGVSVALTADDNTPALATAKIAAAMQASPLYNSTTGRYITYAQGAAVISVGYPSKDGNVKPIAVEPGATGLGSVVNTTQEYATKRPGTGVFAKVNQNILTGQAMVGGPVVSGVVFINGYASADITTVYNNSQATRANVVRAINQISDKTGVKAIDNGTDEKGISLVAADGRNIEVRFEAASTTNAQTFGQRIGLREGVQSATISLESKIDTPVMLTSASTGDITRAGLKVGNYSKNEAVVNTKARDPVPSSTAQVSSVKLTGTAAAGSSVNVVVNGTTFTTNVAAGAVAPATSPQYLTDDLITKINANSTLGVYATKGREVGEILLTARTPGVAFTLTSTTSSGSGISTAATDITANQPSPFKSLGADDLEINGVKIRPTTPADDKFSNTVVSSSDPASSGIALAAAINASTSLSGVKAEANPVVTTGAITTTDTPVGGMQSLWVNGVEVQVNFVQNESGTDRRSKVVDAINQRTGQHGVVATDNGKGVTLTTKDGRNLSVWFDSSKKDLNASDFGLSKGGEKAQISKVSIASAPSVAAGDKVSVMINGVTVSTAALSAAATQSDIANALVAAINANTTLQNVTAKVDPSDANSVLITSNVAGSPFDLRAPMVKTSGGAFTASATVALSTVQANSQGNNDITAVDMSDAYKSNVLGNASIPVSALSIKTLYGTVKLTAAAPNLPGLPGADGLPPNMMNINGDPIQIRSGADGFGALSNFSALGFNEGSFGGKASEDMAPPRVGRMAFQVGAGANQYITIDLADFGKNGSITGAITGDVDLAQDKRAVRINTREGATAVLNLLDTAMDKVNATRATMGAVMNRLDHVINNLSNVSMNMSASRSQIEDADYAKASTDLAKTQIMQQAATAVLAQANTSQQSVLKLLNGG
jgi:flagellin